jgi:hypothetical protein
VGVSYILQRAKAGRRKEDEAAEGVKRVAAAL